MYLESCRAVLEKPHAISVKLIVIILIRDTNMAAKHSIRDLFHEKYPFKIPTSSLIFIHDSMSFLGGKNMDYQ